MKISRILPMLATALLQACSTISVIPRATDAVSGEEACFPGLATSFRAPDTQRIRLIVIHGMGTHSVGWSKEFQEQLLQRKMAIPLKHQYAPPTGDGALVWVSDYEDRERTTTPRRFVRAYEITWSQLTAERKRQLVALDSAEEYSKYRAKLNRWAKIELMDDMFADPLIYLGPGGMRIKEAVQMIILRIIADDLTKPTIANSVFETEPQTRRAPEIFDRMQNEDVVLISFSLGSRIFYDALLCLRRAYLNAKEDPQELGFLIPAFVSRIRKVYLAANQIALIDLAGDPETLQCPPDRPLAQVLSGTSPHVPLTGPLASLFRRSGFERLRSPLDIVAYNDPNDVLTYPITKEACQSLSEKYASRCTNVLVGAADHGLFGIFVNPADAHNGYHKSQTFTQSIAFGWHHGSPGTKESLAMCKRVAEFRD